jgi:hypothetical protein
MKEILRKYIRSIINEEVSQMGTLFGPYYDEVLINKNQIKPQYIKIALKNSQEICSNPTVDGNSIDCPVNYELKKTKHSYERQFRHVDNTIEDEHVNNVVQRGIDKIIKNLISHPLIESEKIHLKDKDSNLNIILGVEVLENNKDENIIRFNVITVMIKREFIPYPGTRTIFV